MLGPKIRRVPAAVLAATSLLFMLSACESESPGLRPKEDAGKPSTISPSQDPDAGRIECETTCQGKCGVPDGCGGTCGCTSGTRCEESECVADGCGKCSEGEMCVGDRCVCAPSCEDRACESDGCGETCACPDGYVQNAKGKWVPQAECQDTCGEAGWLCGELCGQNCGACQDDKTCQLGSCDCVPLCDGTRCDDGCGGICECAGDNVCNAAGACVAPAECKDTCASAGRSCEAVCGQECGACADDASCVTGTCKQALNCQGCSLPFYTLSRKIVDGRIREVTFALDYAPAEHEPRPRLADLRVRANRKATLKSVQLGGALSSAGKALFVNSETGEPWKKRADGSFQILAYRATNTNPFGTGRLMTMTFELNELGPVEFTLVRRLQTFAPPEADAALQSTSYETAVVVSR